MQKISRKKNFKVKANYLHDPLTGKRANNNKKLSVKDH